MRFFKRTILPLSFIAISLSIITILWSQMSVVTVATSSPIIGIFAQPISLHGEYIAASYVKWVESAGGRVVPLPYDAPIEYLDYIIPQLNGVLFPGGGAVVNEKHAYVVNMAKKMNDKGIYFPVWGTCLGLEWLVQIITNDTNSLDAIFDAWNMSIPLDFTKEAKESKLFGTASANIMEWLGTKPITLNNHDSGITPTDFQKYKVLREEYEILSTNKDRKNVEFVSAFESKQYPIYAVQFHPEKNNFEYGENPNGSPFEAINHSYEAVRVSQYLANFFIDEARKNNLSFENEIIRRKSLIYGYQTTAVAWPAFVQCYVFKHDFQAQYWDVTV